MRPRTSPASLSFGQVRRKYWSRPPPPDARMMAKSMGTCALARTQSAFWFSQSAVSTPKNVRTLAGCADVPDGGRPRDSSTGLTRRSRISAHSRARSRWLGSIRLPRSSGWRRWNKVSVSWLTSVTPAPMASRTAMSQSPRRSASWICFGFG
jgi:hypothetical protein